MLVDPHALVQFIFVFGCPIAGSTPEKRIGAVVISVRLLNSSARIASRVPDPNQGALRSNENPDTTDPREKRRRRDEHKKDEGATATAAAAAADAEFKAARSSTALFRPVASDGSSAL